MTKPPPPTAHEKGLPQNPELGLIPQFSSQGDLNMEQADIEELGSNGGVSLLQRGRGYHETHL